MHVKPRTPLTALAAIAAGTMALALGACGSDDSDDQGSSGSDEEFVIGWVPPTVAPFEQAMREGIKLQAQSLGMELEVAGGEFDPSAQISAVDALVRKDVDALLIWPLDEQGIQPALDRARERDIPIITTVSPNARATVNFQTDDAPAAAELARSAAERIGDPCRVGIIEGVPVIPTLKARNEGYAEGAREAGCEILDKQVNTNDTPEKAGEIVGAWKTRFGSEMNGILAINDPSALAAAAQVDDEFQPLIVGANGDAEAITAIQAGRLAGTQAAPSPELGNAMAFAAHQLLTGEEVPETIGVHYDVVTEENIDQYRSYEERLTGPMEVSFQGSGESATLMAAPPAG